MFLLHPDGNSDATPSEYLNFCDRNSVRNHVTLNADLTFSLGFIFQPRIYPPYFIVRHNDVD